ncbi:hypothetical protein D3C78_685070 [compost metagenome]
MAVGQAGFQAERAFAEEAAGFVIDVLDTARRGVVFAQAFAVAGSGLAGGGGGAGQSLWLGNGRLCLDLAYPLLKHHEGFLLRVVTLTQFEQCLLQFSYLGIRGGIQECRRE